MKLNMISIGASDETTDSINTATTSHDEPSYADLRWSGRDDDRRQSTC
jgi:hypothetical protein